MIADKILIKKIMFLPILLFLFSACVSGRAGSSRNENIPFFISSNQTNNYKKHLVCCKKRCVLASALNIGKGHDF